jgi:hypothetical protein
MEVSSVNSSNQFHAIQNSKFAKVKQAFEDLGGALDSGDLSAAKEALSTLQENAPAKAKNDKNNPMAAKMETLSKAIESGDLDAAKEAYADIKTTMAQGPQGGRPAGPPPGPPPSSSGKTSGASCSSSSNKVYDPMDADKNGEVSWEEEQAYLIKHPEAEETSNVDSSRGTIDTFA